MLNKQPRVSVDSLLVFCWSGRLWCFWSLLTGTSMNFNESWCKQRNLTMQAMSWPENQNNKLKEAKKKMVPSVAYINDCAWHKESMQISLYFYFNICPLCFRETTLVLIFVLAAARCVIIIMICATEKSEMVMSWIPSNADSWNGSYFNFLYSVNVIYFDMCKWGSTHLKANRKSQHDYVASPQQHHRFYSNLPPTTAAALVVCQRCFQLLCIGEETLYIWLRFLLHLFQNVCSPNTLEATTAGTTSNTLQISFIIFRTLLLLNSHSPLLLEKLDDPCPP